MSQSDGGSRHRAATPLLAAVGAAIGALLDGWPDSLFRWLTVLLAAVVGAVFSLTSLADYLDKRALTLVKRLRPSRPPRLRLWLLAALALVLAIAFGRSVIAVGGQAADWAAVRLYGCPAPTELRVLTTAEGLTAADRLAEAYSLHTAKQEYDCPAVRMYVYAQPPETAREALRTGWLADSLQTLGPRPDIWLPGSTRYALTDPAGSSNGQLTAAPATSMATSPLVLAVPTADLPGRWGAGRTGHTWAEALTRIEAAEQGPVRPDPARSVTGLFATAAMYASGHTEPRRLAEAAYPPRLVDPVRARQIEVPVAAALDRDGYPLGDATELLCRHRQLDPPPAALAITEQQMIQFNLGSPLGDRCGGTDPPAPERSLTAIYPSDTLSLDHPFVELAWADRSRAQDRQVAAFRTWLASAAGKRELTGLGLRPPNWPAADPIGERFGALAGVTDQQEGLSDRAAQLVRDTWQRAHRPGRVLLLLDASGSMRQAAGPDRRSRFDVATQGVRGLAARMSDRDELGLWVFQGPRREPRQVLPIGPVASGDSASGEPGAGAEAAVTAALEDIRPDGNTPLYRAIMAGAARVGPSTPDRATALVALTDGTDEGSGVGVGQLVAAARDSGTRVFVVAVGEASCASRGIRQVTEATAGACYETDLAGLESRLGELFDTLWEGTDR